jgi:hypothetical protein
MIINFADYISKQSILKTPFKGVVVDNDDPLKLGRVKCTIEELYSGPSDLLPWISQKSPAILGGQTSSGSFFVPRVGSELEIVFPYDDIYFGFYNGFWQSSKTHVSNFDGDYGNEYGFVDNGFEVKYNLESKEFFLIHPSGSKIKITESEFEILSSGSGKITVDSTLDINASGATNITVDSTLDINASGATNITVDSTLDINASGATNIKSDGPITIEASAVLQLNGTQIIIGGGGPPVARLGDTAIGTGNLGAPVVSTIIQGSSKVFSA